MGLAIPLHCFSYGVRPGEPLTLTVDPAQGDDPASWRLALLRPTERHSAALVVRRGEGGPEGGPGRVAIFRTTPLSSHQPLEVKLLASSEQPLG